MDKVKIDRGAHRKHILLFHAGYISVLVKGWTKRRGTWRVSARTVTFC